MVVPVSVDGRQHVKMVSSKVCLVVKDVQRSLTARPPMQLPSTSTAFEVQLG